EHRPDPATTPPQELSAWLSPRDAAELVRAAVEADLPGFTVANGISANRYRVADLEATISLAGCTTDPSTTPGRTDTPTIGGVAALPVSDRQTVSCDRRLADDRCRVRTRCVPSRRCDSALGTRHGVLATDPRTVRAAGCPLDAGSP